MFECFAKCLLVTLTIFISCSSIPIFKNDESVCPFEALVNLNDNSDNINDYPAEWIEKKNGKIYACPCIKKSCISIYCQSDTCKKYLDTNLIPNKVENFREDDLYPVFWNPCKTKGGGYALYPQLNIPDEFKILQNGSLYLPKEIGSEKIFKFTDYYFLQGNNVSDFYKVIKCLSKPVVNNPKYKEPRRIPRLTEFCILISALFFIITFTIYAVLKELNGRYAKCLRRYLILQAIGYSFLGCIHILTISTCYKIVCKLIGKL